jgi:hypothetical protein
MQPVLQFLKKHYEKIILCLVLLGLAAAAIWMGNIIRDVQKEVDDATSPIPPSKKALDPLDLTTDLLALAAVTNPPPVILSGAHNLFNPVAWKRKPNGDLLKILKTGADALDILTNTPLYTIIGYDHSSGGGVYVLDITIHSMKKPPIYAKKGDVNKKWPFIIRGIKGAEDNPDELQLEIPETGQTVSISKDNPYKAVDGHTVDLRYEPELRTFNKQKVNDTITLDNEQYKIVEITDRSVTVESISNHKKTTINWNGNP